MRRSIKKDFLKAVECGNAGRVRALLAEGAAPSFKTSHGETPLFLAIHRAQPQIALLLLEAGADPGARADDGATPLFWAARYGFAEVATALVERGASVHDSRDGTAPPLAMAVTGGHVRIAALLVEHGADPDRPYVGRSLMDHASTAEMRRALVRRRADPSRW